MTPRAKARMVLAGASQVTEGTGQVLVGLKNRVVYGLAGFFSNRASKIRQREEDPEGYAADELIDEAATLVNKMQKRKAKNKAFKPVQVAKATVLIMILDEIAAEHLGENWAVARAISAELSSLLGRKSVEDKEHCPYCNASLPTDAKFCGGCGTSLSTKELEGI